MRKLNLGGKTFRNQSINQSINQSLKALALFVVLVVASSSASAQMTINTAGLVTFGGNKLTIGTTGSYFGIDGNSLGYSVYLGKTNQFMEVRSATFWSYQYQVTSDKRLKKNFRTIDKPLEKILKLSGQKYDYIADKYDSIGTKAEQETKVELKKDRLGFIAQEVLDIVPEAVVYNKEEDLYLIDYNTFIPVIVEAMKEQQATIDELTTRIATLEGSAAQEKSATIDGTTTTALLDQNVPNPFSANTSIGIHLPATVSRASLYIYNMQGSQIKQIAVNERGDTSVIIEGSTLKAGIYYYTLIADDKEVDTKKMILTK